MSSRKKLFLLAVSGAVLASALSACSNTTPIGESLQLWSAYDTVKVVKSGGDEYFDRLDAKINISMMKNESESGQFIITALENIKNFNIRKCDLKRLGGSEVISQDDISVYVQKYIEINNKFNLGNTSFVSGDQVPDMLLPIEKSVEYKENHISKGDNQGITVDVKTHKDTKAGRYYGNFTLVADGKEYEIPVEVEVWDILKSGRNKVQSCFLIYKNYLLQGEYNTTYDMIYAYYDYLLEYNVNSYIIHDKDQDASYRNSYVQNVKERINNESLNSIVIPVYYAPTYTFASGTSADVSARESGYQYIKGLVQNSTQDADLISLAYFYSSAFDEANVYETLYPQAINFYKKGGELEQTLEYYQERLEEEGVFDALLRDGNSSTWVNKVKDFIVKIPSVWPTTMYEDKQVDDMIVTNCPTLNQFDTGIYEQKLVDGAAKSNGNLWTYTCSGPRNPYPTFHLDDYNLGTRVTGWMLKKYNINGYLYWASNLYEPVGVFGSLDNYVDPYTTADRAGKCPGDGFLLYPGNYYGHFGPYGSLRLKNYRDSMDDYELLTIYEDLLKERSEKYGVEFDFDKYVTDLYDSLFSGTIYIKEDALLAKARKELARRILSLQNEDELMFDTYSDGEAYHSTIYAAQSILNINGQQYNGTKSKAGYVYSVNTPVNSVNKLVIKTNYLYEFALNNSGLLLDSTTRYTASTNSSVSVNGATGCNFTINSVYKDEGEEIGGKTQRFLPGITFNNSNFSKISNIQFSVTNTSSEEIEFYIYLSNDYVDNEIYSVTLKPGQTRDVNVNVLKMSSNFLSSVSSWSIKMKNVTTNSDGNMVLYPERSFTTSPIVYVERGN